MKIHFYQLWKSIRIMYASKGERWKLTGKGHEGTFQVDGNILYLNMVCITPVYQFVKLQLRYT